MQRLDNNKAIFIAEIGKNFITSENVEPVEILLKKAKELVLAAKRSGADIVKFQTHNLNDEILKVPFSSPHFKGQERYKWVKRNQESTPFDKFWVPLFEFCNKSNIKFLSTPMSKGAAKLLFNLGVDSFKVGSGDVTDFRLISYLCDLGFPIMISTGMVSYSELSKVSEYILSRNVNLTIMYCISEYPCSESRFNMSSITRINELFPSVNIGFSDHSINSLNSIVAAYIAGARIFEKHFTFDRSSWGSDHKSSLLPNEFLEMVNKIKNIKKINLKEYNNFFGSKYKELDGADNKFRPLFRKGIAFSTSLKAGAIIKEKDLITLRPVNQFEIDSIFWFDLIGKKVLRKVKKYKKLQWNDVDSN